MKKSAVIIFILTFFHALCAEDILSDRIRTVWTSNQGLVSDTVKDIVQDKYGFIIMGTFDGLVRFDGVKFNVMNKYSNPDFNSVSARVLIEDRAGRLWVGTNGDGVAVISNSGIKMLNTDDGLPDNSIRSIAQDRDGVIWIGTTRGVCYVKDNIIKRPNSTDVFKNNELIEFIYADYHGNIWLAPSGTGLFKFQNGSFVMSDMVSSNIYYTRMFQDTDGGYYIGTKENGLIYHKSGSSVFYNKSNGFISNKVNHIMKDNSGNMWFGTDDGIIIKQGEVFKYYSERDGLTNNLIEKIIEDRESNIWIATSRGGVEKLSRSKFKSFKISDGLIHNTVNAIAHDDEGRVWIGTDNGLSCIAGNGTFESNQLTEYLKGVRIRDVRSYGSDIFVSTYSSKGFVIFNGNRITVYNESSGLSGNRVRVSLKTSTGDIYVGTTNGLNKITGDGNVIQFRKTSGLTDNYIMCLHEDKRGNLYIGTDGGGINIMNLRNGAIRSLTSNDGLAGNVIFKILGDNDEILWISTGNGVSRFDGENFFNFNVGNGLASDSVFQVLEDASGRLWMTSNKGVFYAKKFDMNSAAKGALKKIDIRYFDKNDGLPGGITAVSVSSADKSGNLWFSTLDGVAMIDPLNILTNIYPPLVKINEVKLDEVSADINSVIKVRPGIKRVSFEYSGLSFTVPERVLFRYKLEGFDNNFSSPTTSRYVTYTNLPPAKYTFKLKAANNDGIWGDETDNIVIIQKPYFYQNIYFYIVSLLIFIGIIYILYSIRVRHLQRRQLELEELVQVRTKDLSDEKEKSESLLLNILPLSIAKRLKSGEKAIADRFESATVLFADIVNFSELSVETSPSQLLFYLNSLFSEFDQLTEEFGIEKIKTIGDAYMAVAGVPDVKSNHKEIMVDFAFKMLDKIDSVNKTLGTSMEMRIGINAGPVVAGVIGKKKFIYDLWGEAVNLASRMEQHGQPGKIHVSEDLYNSLSHIYSFEELKKVHVKGAGLIKTYNCIGRK